MQTRCRQLLLLGSFLFFCSLLSAQNTCESPVLRNGTFLHGNNVRALYAASGSQFWDALDSQFGVETSTTSVNTIFTQGIWMGGIDPGGNLRISAANYGASNGSSDYFPGPIPISDDCVDYDRAWEVYRYQIEAHMADFADNGVIDEPIQDVVGWPGTGNPEFAGIYGFELPFTPQGLAPYFDQDGDGAYEPLDGEYPIVERHQLIPEHMVWTIFNNIGNLSTDSGSEAVMPTEIHCLAWAINCTDSELLNNSIFSTYRFINRGTEPYDSVRIAMWNDFDLGCFADDFIGSAPELNTFFAYNADNIDDINCAGTGIMGAGEDPPAQAITLLNRPLDAFIYTNGGGFIPPPTEELPSLPAQYFNLLNGVFVDGVPITEGGNGYDPDSDEVRTHVFPGDPNDLSDWTAADAGGTGDWRALGSTFIDDTWEAGEVIELDLAYSYYRDPGLNFLENVTAMYNGLPEIQDWYATNFSEACTRPSICAEDCIWSGDLNADGIANHEDAIALGFGTSATGNTRPGPYNWSPQDGEAWAGTQIFGTNNKHLDANGDGSATGVDLEFTERHYNETRPGYQAIIEYPEGDELVFRRPGTDPDLTGLEPGEFFFGSIELVEAVEDLRAIAFTLEYEPAFYETFRPFNPGSEPEDFLITNRDIPGLIDYAHYLGNPDNTLEIGTLFNVQVRIREDFPMDFPTDETKVSFRNIRGFLSDGTEIDLGAMEVTIQVDGVVSTQEPQWASGLQLFPNPVKHHLQLRSTTNIEQIDIFDNKGRLLRTINTPFNSIDVQALPAGMYHLRIYSANESVVRKFVKQE